MIEHLAIVRQEKFGTEELLHANARVLYENLFSTRHVGRVIDFMLFEAKGALSGGGDEAYLEYRLRQILESAVFNGFANYRKGEKSKCVELELGWDDERLVASAAFLIDDDAKDFLPRQKASNAAAARIQKLLGLIQGFSDDLVVRFDPRLGRVQIISLLSIRQAKESGGLEVEFVDVSKLAPAADPPRSGKEAAASPENLASRDASRFTGSEREFEKERSRLTHLKEAEEDKRQAVAMRVHEQAEREEKKKRLGIGNVGASAQGADLEFHDREKPRSGTAFNFVEHLEGAAEQEIGRSKRTSLGSGDRQLLGGEDENARLRPKAANKGGNDLTLKTERLSTDQEKIVVGSTERIDTSGDVLKVKTLGAGAPQGALSDTVMLSEAENEDVEEVLQILLKTIRAELVTVVTGLSDDQFEEVFRTVSLRTREAFLQGIHHLARVRSIQLVTKVKHYKEQIGLLNSKVESLKQQLEEAKTSAAPAQAAPAAPSRDAKTAQNMSKGLFEEALREKAALNEKVRHIDDHLRRREFDFKTKEATLVEQIRLKDEGVKQKQFALDKIKEMLTTAMEHLERYKKAVASSVSEAEMKLKLAGSEKLISAAKENNEKLSKRVEELQKKWGDEFAARSRAQEELSKKSRENEEAQKKIADLSKNSVDAKRLAEVTAAKDRALRLSEEFRRQNAELQGKLAAHSGASAKIAAARPGHQHKAGEGSDVETRHRLDQASKLVRALQEDLSRQKKRFDDLKLEETKLRVEVAKLQNQLKAAHKASGGKGPKP